MTTNQPTNLDKGTIEIYHTTTDRGQQITTRLRTKKIPIKIIKSMGFRKQKPTTTTTTTANNYK